MIVLSPINFADISFLLKHKNTQVKLCQSRYEDLLETSITKRMIL